MSYNRNMHFSILLFMAAVYLVQHPSCWLNKLLHICVYHPATCLGHCLSYYMRCSTATGAQNMQLGFALISNMSQHCMVTCSVLYDQHNTTTDKEARSIFTRISKFKRTLTIACLYVIGMCFIISKHIGTAAYHVCKNTVINTMSNTQLLYKNISTYPPHIWRSYDIYGVYLNITYLWRPALLYVTINILTPGIVYVSLHYWAIYFTCTMVIPSVRCDGKNQFKTQSRGAAPQADGETAAWGGSVFGSLAVEAQSRPSHPKRNGTAFER